MSKSNKVQDFYTEQSEIRKQERFLTQCFLINNLTKLVKEKEVYGDCYKHFLKVDMDPSVFLGKVTRNSDKEKFINEILPYELSALVPEIRLFKVEYDPKDTSQYKQFEFFFDNGITEQDITDITKSNTMRSTGVGLKSVNWKFIGSNPAESKRLIQVELQILFSSMQDLAKKTALNLSFLDLIKPRKKSVLGEELDSSYHQIKMQLGWATPKENHALFQNKPEIIQAVKDSKMSMFLSLQIHDLKFEQTGKVLLTAKFWGRLESRSGASSPSRFDVLELSEEDKKQRKEINEFSQDATSKIKARIELLDCVSKQAKNRKDVGLIRKIKRESKKINELYSKLIQERKKFLLSEKKLRYENLLHSLIKENKVYYLVVDKKSIGIFNDKVSKSGTGTAREKKKTKLTDSQHSSYLQKFRNLSKLYNDGKVLSNKKLLDSRIPTFNDDILVHYFFLGDLFDIVLDKLYKKDKEFFTRFLVGSIENPLEPNKYLSIADIPVSLQTFSIWFSNTIIKMNKDTYAFNDFIRDILVGLVKPIFNHPCLQITTDPTQTKQNTNIHPRISLFNLNGQGKDGKVDPIINSNVPYSKIQNDFVVSRVIEPCNKKVTLEALSQKKNIIEEPGKPNFEYFFIYAVYDKINYRRKANYFTDSKDGIYHFYVGSDRGLLKTAEFVNQTQPYQKEAIMQGTDLEWLKRLYDVNLNLYGVGGFYPGMKVFVNPTSIGLGNPGDVNSIASELGLGGYYVITEVSGELESGKFNTTLRCKWESRGNGQGFKDNENNNEDCLKRYRKKVGKEFGRFWYGDNFFGGLADTLNQKFFKDKEIK